MQSGQDMLDWITVLQRAQAHAINTLLQYSVVDSKVIKRRIVSKNSFTQMFIYLAQI